jgi:chromosome partitioning protein
MPMLTLTILARKGGTGKTTTAWNLAGLYAQEGLRILAIDLDGQASLSRVAFGSTQVEKMHPAQTVAGLFDPHYDPAPAEVIQASRFERLSVIAAGDALETHNRPSPETAGEAQFTIRRLLAEVEASFDLAIIDTGPNTTGLAAWSALAASDLVLSPVLADSFGTQAVIHVQRLVEAVQTRVNPKLRILGYLLNMTQKNVVNQAYEQTLRQLHGRQVLETTVPLLAPYREAIAERTPITIFKPRIKASKIVKSLAEEITARITKPAHATKEAA